MRYWRNRNYINQHGIKCKKINKVNQGSPHIVDVLNAKKIALVINTGGGNSEKQINDALALRRATEIKFPIAQICQLPKSVLKA